MHYYYISTQQLEDELGSPCPSAMRPPYSVGVASEGGSEGRGVVLRNLTVQIHQPKMKYRNILSEFDEHNEHILFIL